MDFFSAKEELVPVARERQVPVLPFQGTAFEGSVQLPKYLGSFQAAQGNPSVAWISWLVDSYSVYAGFCCA